MSNDANHADRADHVNGSSAGEWGHTTETVVSTPPLIPVPLRLDLLDGDRFVVDTRFGEFLSSEGCHDAGDHGSYTLRVTAEKGFEVKAAGPEGMAAAKATAHQLIQFTSGRVPPLEIFDAPRYAWRGVMIDIARHFFGPKTLRKVIDLAAAYKLNMLHLHLTDDQGWRLDVPSRPELVEHSSRTDIDGGPGGHLSSDDLAELVDYAAERGITLVGEIDVPGHATAAMHAVPALNADGVARPTKTEGGVFDGVLDLSLPETAPFLEDVFSALAAATSGEFLHVGGDEVPSLTREQYRDVIQHLEALVLRLGKRPVFWQEAAFALRDARSVVQLWSNHEGLDEVVAAARRGHDVVLSPGWRVYLDMKYDEHFPIGVTWSGIVDIDTAYDWDPDTEVEGLPAERILGVEAPLWTETIRTEDDLFTMLLPRLAAVAEVAWSSPDVRDWEKFAEHVAAHAEWWQTRGYRYAERPQIGSHAGSAERTGTTPARQRHSYG